MEHIIDKQKTVWVQHDKNIYNEECFIYLNTINNRDYIRNQIGYPYLFTVYPWLACPVTVAPHMPSVAHRDPQKQETAQCSLLELPCWQGKYS